MSCAAPAAAPELREFYPLVEPFEAGFLKVDDIHSIYYEQSGNKDGNPVLVVHGGPGGGCPPYYRQYFDSTKYRVVMVDQRGAGQSTPPACLKNNTTWHLIQDFETLREKLGIDKWVVFGGSWGSTLSLAYAIKHPDRVKALILRGIFTLRRKELMWFYQSGPTGGAQFIYPDAWEAFLAPIPVVERHDLMSAYYRRLTGDNEAEKRACALAWSIWEMRTSKLIGDPNYVKRAADDIEFAIRFASIESHYFVHGGFFESDEFLIDGAKGLNGRFPITIVQGRYDIVCPAITAWELKKNLPDAELYMIDDAGHSCTEPGIRSRLITTTDRCADL